MPASKCSGQSCSVVLAPASCATQWSSTRQPSSNQAARPASSPGSRTSGRSTSPSGIVAGPAEKSEPRSAPANSASPASVAPSSEREVEREPTSRMRAMPAVRRTSGSGPKAGVATPPGLDRRPKRPLTSKRRRPSTCAESRCSSSRVVPMSAPNSNGGHPQAHRAHWAAPARPSPLRHRLAGEWPNKPPAPGAPGLRRGCTSNWAYSTSRNDEFRYAKSTRTGAVAGRKRGW